MDLNKSSGINGGNLRCHALYHSLTGPNIAVLQTCTVSV